MKVSSPTLSEVAGAIREAGGPGGPGGRGGPGDTHEGRSRPPGQETEEAARPSCCLL